MSESSTKFLNKDGEVNSIVLDPSSNSAVVKNNDGDILVKYTNGTWEPTSFAPVDILKDSKSGSTYDRGLKFAFDDFEIKRVANYSQDKILELLQNKLLIRNKAKINSIVNNAQRILLLEDEYAGFDEYLWQFVDNAQKVNFWHQNDIVPAVLDPAEEISRDMIQRGFKFCGPTIIYAYIQSVGLVNDHRIGCFKHGNLKFDLSR